MGHDRLADLTSGLYEYIEEHEKGGATYPEIDLGIARMLVLDGREDEAMARLQQALAKTLYTPWIPIDPVLDQLSGREDYEALVSEIEKQVNAERGKLELTPVTLTRSMARINRTSIQN
jgi:hypothetical protein